MSCLNWSRATHGANNSFDHIARVVSIVVGVEICL